MTETYEVVYNPTKHTTPSFFKRLWTKCGPYVAAIVPAIIIVVVVIGTSNVVVLTKESTTTAWAETRTYEGHQYVCWQLARGSAMVHDPDCPCGKKGKYDTRQSDLPALR